MTVEEIKQTVSMRDVLSRYGLKPHRNGMISCPFHKDRHPSMKIYPDGFKCFSCGRNGDIFTFVQNMENVDFKGAFLQLGGTYAETNTERSKALYKGKYERIKREKQQDVDEEKEFKRLLERAIEKCNFIINYGLPFSDEWCFAQDTCQWLQYVWEEKYIEGKEVKKIDVYRKCKRLNIK